MDLRQLRSFAAVAEELHFTRAAARLHLAQSALSAQIRALEREVGAPLLTRDTRNVALTAVGVAFLQDAREVIELADAALGRARVLARSREQRLVVGCLGPAPGELLTMIVTRLVDERPGADVQVRAFGFGEVLACVRSAQVDVAFLYLPFAEEELAGLDVRTLREEERVVVMARSHPLAARATLTPADLAGERFVSHTDAVSPTWRDFWLLTEQLGGRRPPLAVHTADTLDDWLHLIASGDGIDTAPAIVARYYSWPGLACVPLVGAPPAALAVALPCDRRAPLAERFAALAQELGAPAGAP